MFGRQDLVEPLRYVGAAYRFPVYIGAGTGPAWRKPYIPEAISCLSHDGMTAPREDWFAGSRDADRVSSRQRRRDPYVSGPTAGIQCFRCRVLTSITRDADRVSSRQRRRDPYVSGPTAGIQCFRCRVLTSITRDVRSGLKKRRGGLYYEIVGFFRWVDSSVGRASPF